MNLISTIDCKANNNIFKAKLHSLDLEFNFKCVLIQEAFSNFHCI